MEKKNETSWVLWAVALSGLFIWLGQHLAPHKAALGKTSPGVPATTPSLNLTPLLSAAVDFLALLLGIACLIVGGMVASRLYWRWRRARQTVLCEIVLGPDDEAKPFEVMSALDAIHMTLAQRYVRGVVGQDYWTFEIVKDRQGVVHFVIATQARWLTAIQNAWRSKYTNIRFRPYQDVPRTWKIAQQIVLEKSWHIATETVRDYTASVVETIVQMFDQNKGEAHLQIHMTPLPMGAYHDQVQQRIRASEYNLRAQQVVDQANQGVGYVEDKTLKNSLQLMGKGVFRTEIRLGTDNWEIEQGVFGALSQANDENRFHATTVVFAKRLWHAWFWSRMPSLFLFRPCILFTFPLATIIHLPTNRPRVNTLNRSLVRRAPAPLEIRRVHDVKDAIMLDHETKAPLTILERDREANILILGSQGSGKTTDLLSVFRVDAAPRPKSQDDKAVVLLDIGKDTSRRALGLVPPERDVIYYAPADPRCPWTLNPLQASVTDAVLADNILEMLTQVFGEDAIGARSREFLGNSVVAVREVLGDQADFMAVYRMLTDETFRNQIASQVQDEHQAAYWRTAFPAALAADPRFVTDGLAAPRNKLDEILRNPLIRATLDQGRGRHRLDLRDVIRRRAVLVANLDKSQLGDAGVRLLGIMLVKLLWNALQAQNVLEEKQRVPVSLILDEGQNYLSEGFLDMLAEGRAYGLQTTLAIRFLGEIESERLVHGLHALVQNVIIHQFQLLKEAEEFMRRFMRVYANMVQVSAEAQDNLNFGADDIMRLPKFLTINQWVVHGSIRPAWLGETINWEPFYREEWRQAHLRSQPVAKAEPIRVVPSASPSVISVVPPPPVPAPSPAVETKPALPSPSEAESETGEAPDVADAYVDHLTGLGNGKGLEKALKRDIESAAVAFIDIDGLKEINDRTKSHEEGDKLLRRAADAIRSAVRDGDYACRRSGDEYVVILPGFTEEMADTWLARVREAFEAHAVQASIGIAVQRPGETLQAALQRADRAMYEDKMRRKQGRNAVGLSSDAEALVYRVAAERGIEVPVLVNAIKASGAEEDDVVKACLWLLDHREIPDEWATHTFRDMLRKSAAARTLVAAKEYTCRRLGVTRAELEAALQKAGITNEAFVPLARAFWKERHGQKATLAEFVKSGGKERGESGDQEAAGDVQRVKEDAAKRFRMPVAEFEEVLREEGISDEAFVAFSREFFRHPGQRQTVNEFRLAWRKSQLKGPARV